MRCAIALYAIESRLTRATHCALRTTDGGHAFNPVAHAPIQILGLLEAAGQPFDALWVTGLAAERWPAAAQPNPLLPASWQRERNVPHSTAARELAYAQAITAQLTRAAPAVVVSHAHAAEGHPRAVVANRRAAEATRPPLPRFRPRTHIGYGAGARKARRHFGARAARGPAAPV
jgi:hypothetical protein